MTDALLDLPSHLRDSNSTGLGSLGRRLQPGFGLFNELWRELVNQTLCGQAPKSQACMLGIRGASTKSYWDLHSARYGRAPMRFSTVPGHLRYWLDGWTQRQHCAR